MYACNVYFRFKVLEYIQAHPLGPLIGTTTKGAFKGIPKGFYAVQHWLYAGNLTNLLNLLSARCVNTS